MGILCSDSLGTIWEHLKKSKRGNCLTIKQLPLLQVPGAGVEPAHPFGHWCLRPTRLPIPPSGLGIAPMELLPLFVAAGEKPDRNWRGDRPRIKVCKGRVNYAKKQTGWWPLRKIVTNFCQAFLLRAAIPN